MKATVTLSSWRAHDIARTAGRFTLYLFAMSIGLAMWPASVRGQVEAIVRPEEGSAIKAQFESSAKTDQTDLLAGLVRAVRPLFLPNGAPGKASTQPLPAYLLEVADSVSLALVIDSLGMRSDVRYVQRNHRYSVDRNLDGDPLGDSLDHFSVVSVEEAWSVTSGSPTVTVGLVDTGVRFDHPDLAGQFAILDAEDIDRDGRITESDFNGVDDDGNGYVDDVAGFDFVDRPQTVEPGDYRDPDPLAHDDGSGHGTNVAGIVAAARSNGIGISGIAPDVRLVPLRAFGRDGRGDDDDIARAIIYAADTRISVLNLSFGDGHVSPLMQEAIRYAVDRGVVVVASAGNVGGDEPHYPSDYPEVISVVWLSADGAGPASRATSGVGVDIGAPGSSIFTTVAPPDLSGDAEDQYYGRRSGSSMAAPMVSAAAALIRTVDPALSPASVRSILTGSATDLGEEGWDHDTGAGLLNVGRAVRQALPGRIEVTFPVDNQGITNGPVAVIGTVADPSFDFFTLSYAVGDNDLRVSDWVAIGSPRREQVWDRLLAEWDVDDLEDGLYTLRLAVHLRSGRTVEDRRRIYIDRTRPEVTLRLAGAGLIQGLHGIIADVQTDDLSDVKMEVQLGGHTHLVDSARRARRHGLFWSDHSLAGGTAIVSIRATNTAGLQKDTSLVIPVPRREVNTGLVEVLETNAPGGFLLDQFTDFDKDGLSELVLNIYEDGWIGDTLAVLEWAGGTTFVRAASVVAGVIPRDAGDTDGDGLAEVLTQVGAATLLIEQAEGSYLDNVIFSDTTGLSGDSDSALWGARLADMDSDGRQEIVGHNTREWRVLEVNDGAFAEVTRVSNPTSVSSSELGENSFEQPYALIGDLDGDGRPDMLVGDSDGDWILYESDGNNALRAAWWYETDRYDGGSRLAAGDLNGDGRQEFVVYDHNWLTTTSNGERQPDVGRYTVFSNAGDDSFEMAGRLLMAGEITRHGSMSIMDMTGDGTDDLVVANPPDLYVLTFGVDFESHMVFHAGLESAPGFDGYRSIRMVSGDLDGDGLDEIVLTGANQRLKILRPSVAGQSLPAPSWVSAVAIDDVSVALAWSAPGTDSVRVYRSREGGDFDPIVFSSSSSLVDSTTATSRYAIRGWYVGQEGPLSEAVTVRPHLPAVVTSVERYSKQRIQLTFSEAMHPGVTAAQFTLEGIGPAASLMLGKQGRSVILEVPGATVSGGILRWADVKDQEGTAVGQSSVAIEAIVDEDRSLVLSSWDFLSSASIRLGFSAPVDPLVAGRTENYRVLPAGSIASIDIDELNPTDVVIWLDGIAVGSTGLGGSLTVVSMRSVDGRSMAPEGATIRLTGPAEDLRDVYVFPNPFRRTADADGLMVAGLPPGASIQVFSSDGVLVRALDEEDGNGGVLWDTRDLAGRSVPSGVYLILVRFEGQSPVLKKAAVIH